MLRKLHRSDLTQLLAIEQATHLMPWTENTFKTCFQTGCLGWVIESEKKMVGFIIISLRSSECHILNLCVDPHYQHQGLGRQLLEHAMTQAKQHGVEMIYLEVRRSNTRAISLYEKEGFRLLGERKEYYPSHEGHEDALVLAKMLGKIGIK